MKKAFAALFASMLFTTVPAFSQSLILFEDFEDADVAYSGPPDALDGLSNRDYYGRISLQDLPSSLFYDVPQGGQYFYGAEDINDASPGSIPNGSPLTLDFEGIAIHNYTELAFGILVAEDDDGTNQDWDASDSFLVQYQIDGGGYSDLFAIESSGATNTEPREDADFDGIGEGIAITDTFSEFVKDISGNGSFLDLRVTWLSGNYSGEEDLAIDNIRITGTPVPEVSSVWLTGAIVSILLTIRRRRNQPVCC